MTQRDRLIRLISDMQDGGSKQGDHIMHTGFISNEKLTDYLLANGVIVTPCIAMVEHTAHNGKIAVVYKDTAKSISPLIDITE